MNIHPIFVHFPIALLTVYAIAELLRFKSLRSTAYFFYVKAVLIITGVLSALLALNTGETAEHLQDKSLRPLIEMHSAFATASTWIFVILALAYLVGIIERSQYNEKLQNSFFAKIWNIKIRVANYILSSYISFIIALVGLVTITITGALGGAIVYGPAIDPIVNYVYHLFF